MSDQRFTCESTSLEETTVFNKWKIAAIVEALDRQDLGTKQDFDVIINELPRFRKAFKRATTTVGE